MFTSKVWTDDSRQLQEPNLAARQPHGAASVLQAITGEGLAQGLYVAARGGVELTTFRTEGTDNIHLINHVQFHDFCLRFCLCIRQELQRIAASSSTYVVRCRWVSLSSVCTSAVVSFTTDTTSSYRALSSPSWPPAPTSCLPSQENASD